MAIVSLNTIKNWFRTAKKPTQGQFWDTFDSFYHKDEKLPIEAVNNLSNLINNKLDTDQFDGHVNSKDNPHQVTAEQVGLGDIDERLDAKLDKDDERIHDHSNLSALAEIGEDEEGAPTWSGEPWPCGSSSSTHADPLEVDSFVFDAQQYPVIIVTLDEDKQSDKILPFNVTNLREGTTIIHIVPPIKTDYSFYLPDDWGIIGYRGWEVYVSMFDTFSLEITRVGGTYYCSEIQISTRESVFVLFSVKVERGLQNQINVDIELVEDLDPLVGTFTSLSFRIGEDDYGLTTELSIPQGSPKGVYSFVTSVNYLGDLPQDPMPLASRYSYLTGEGARLYVPRLISINKEV